MIVNVVMLVKDRHKLTSQSLYTLIKNTPRESFNLTLVDDNSEFPIGLYTYGKEILNCEWTCLRIEKSKRITGQARNLGVYWAEKYWGRGDWLYLTDNDVYFTPRWLERLIEILRSTNLDLIGGWNHPFLQPKAGTAEVYDTIDVNIALHDAVTGASQLMRWSTWDKYGPLDAHAPGVGQSEDWAMCQKIIKDGGRVGSIYPRVVLNCGVTNSYGKPSVGADVMVAELVEAKKQWPDLYWE